MQIPIPIRARVLILVLGGDVHQRRLVDGILGEVGIVVEVDEVVAEAGVGDWQDRLSRRAAADADAGRVSVVVVQVRPARVTSVDRGRRRRGRGLDAAEAEAEAEAEGRESEAEAAGEGPVRDGRFPLRVLGHLDVLF